MNLHYIFAAEYCGLSKQVLSDASSLSMQVSVCLTGSVNRITCISCIQADIQSVYQKEVLKFP